MRLMIMFDLPVETSEDRRNYRKFRRALIDEGFLMMQYSIYVRVMYVFAKQKNQLRTWSRESQLSSHPLELSKP